MVGIYGLLLLSLLLLLVPISYRTQSINAYAQIDFSIFDSDIGMHTQVIANTILIFLQDHLNTL